jgi:glycerophosphoryl diester phosphodiesterase
MSSEWKEPHPLWVVGHRGAPRRERENTIASFDLAESLGADAIELDVQQTRDGELVVFHDDEIVIGTDRHPVRSMASHDIRELILDSPLGEYRIPTLEQVLARYGTSLRCVVEIKVNAATNRPAAARRASELIAGFSMTRVALVASFDAEVLRLLRDRRPEIAVSFLFSQAGVFAGSDFSSAPFPRVDAIGPKAELVTAEMLERARSAKLTVHPWTADTPEEVERLSTLGVDSITTNDCEMARAVLRKN